MKSGEKNVKVTIIVTVHNSEKYLKSCLRSVCEQTLKEIEILCIDGGSSDSSPEILCSFQKNDERIRVINDPNTSYGHKINVGMSYAKGEYIAILESDDMMLPDMLKTLYDVAQEQHADVVDTSYYGFFENGENIYQYKVVKYSEKNCYNHLIHRKEDALPIVSTAAIWTGIYKRSFLEENHIRLNESQGASYQDISFGFLTGLLAESTYHLDIPLHQYRMDNNGSSVKDNKKVFEVVGECEFLKSELQKRNINDLKIWTLFYLKKYNVFFWNACRLTGSAREEFIEKYQSELEKDITYINLERETLSQEDYIRTFMLLEDKQAFLQEVEHNFQNNANMMTNICYMIEKIGAREIVIVGCGLRGEQVLDLYHNNMGQIKCLCDNSVQLQNTVKNGYKILSVAQAVERFPSAVYIIANYRHSKEIKKQLLQLKIPEQDIYIFKQETLAPESRLVQ